MCIAEALAPQQATQQEQPAFAKTWIEKFGIAAAVAILLAMVANGTDFTQRGLDRAISSEYPVNAINFLRRSPVQGPRYNALNWGGFLMWYMPEFPVAIDGRNDFYGDDLDRLFYNSQSAEKSYTTDPYLNQSGVVLLGSEMPLARSSPSTRDTNSSTTTTLPRSSPAPHCHQVPEWVPEQR